MKTRQEITAEIGRLVRQDKEPEPLATLAAILHILYDIRDILDERLPRD